VEKDDGQVRHIPPPEPKVLLEEVPKRFPPGVFPPPLKGEGVDPKPKWLGRRRQKLNWTQCFPPLYVFRFPLDVRIFRGCLISFDSPTGLRSTPRPPRLTQRQRTRQREKKEKKERKSIRKQMGVTWCVNLPVPEVVPPNAVDPKPVPGCGCCCCCCWLLWPKPPNAFPPKDILTFSPFWIPVSNCLVLHPFRPFIRGLICQKSTATTRERDTK
jgi:hypothetical protein